jgi:type III restriction enzyme
MPTFDLKRYQRKALEALDEWLRAARLTGPRAAFEAATDYGYNPESFGETPCACLRIPPAAARR